MPSAITAGRHAPSSQANRYASVRRLPPDGQTLLLGVAATQAVNPALFADLPYDPERDFAPVALLGVTGFVLVVPQHALAAVATDLEALGLAHRPIGQVVPWAGSGERVRIG